MSGVRYSGQWPRFLFRALIFALVWWLLTEGQAGSWWIGVPAVLLATIVSMQMLPRVAIRLSGLWRLVPYFLYHSLLGGVDVATRALHPKLPIAPDIVDYRTGLAAGLPRVLLTNMISLLPGTLSVMLEEDRLRVHVLDGTVDITASLQDLEQRIAAVFPPAAPGFDNSIRR